MKKEECLLIDIRIARADEDLLRIRLYRNGIVVRQGTGLKPCIEIDGLAIHESSEWFDLIVDQLEKGDFQQPYNHEGSISLEAYEVAIVLLGNPESTPIGLNTKWKSINPLRFRIDKSMTWKNNRQKFLEKLALDAERLTASWYHDVVLEHCLGYRVVNKSANEQIKGPEDPKVKRRFYNNYLDQLYSRHTKRSQREQLRNITDKLYVKDEVVFQVKSKAKMGELRIEFNQTDETVPTPIENETKSSTMNMQEPLLKEEEIELITLSTSINEQEIMYIKLYREGTIMRRGTGGMPAPEIGGMSSFGNSALFNEMIKMMPPDLYQHQMNHEEECPNGSQEMVVAFYGDPEGGVVGEQSNWRKCAGARVKIDLRNRQPIELAVVMDRLLQGAHFITAPWFTDIALLIGEGYSSSALPKQTMAFGPKDKTKTSQHYERFKLDWADLFDGKQKALVDCCLRKTYSKGTEEFELLPMLKDGKLGFMKHSSAKEEIANDKNSNHNFEEIKKVKTASQRRKELKEAEKDKKWYDLPYWFNKWVFWDQR